MVDLERSLGLKVETNVSGLLPLHLTLPRAVLCLFGLMGNGSFSFCCFNGGLDVPARRRSLFRSHHDPG